MTMKKRGVDVQKKSATWEDLEKLGELERGELVDGEVVLLPSPGDPHSGAAIVLTVSLAGPFQFGGGGSPGGWVFRADSDIFFGHQVRRPDLAGWRTERFDAPDKGPYRVVPDWVCEIISPKGESRDRVEKLVEYEAAGVRHYWLVNPEEFLLEVLRLEGGRYQTMLRAARRDVVRAEPFEAVMLDLSLLWGKRLDQEEQS